VTPDVGARPQRVGLAESIEHALIADDGLL